MARNRNTNGSVGISKDALEALKSGNYGKVTGRKATATSSKDQIIVANPSNPLPVLNGIKTNNTAPAQNNYVSKNKNYIDTDRARRNYAAKQTTPKTSSDENYVVKRDRYDKLMKNGRLANDIKTLAQINYQNANQDATVSQEWADEYGAKSLTGGLSKSQFIDQLSRRYELTKDELNDMALTFHTDANNLDVEQYGKQLEKIGKEHPVVGSAGSFVGTIGSGIEGIYNTIAGLGGDDRYLSNMFRTTKNSPREGAKQNIESNVGKGLYDIAMGVGDMVAGTAAGSAPVILAGNTANEAQKSALERGSSVRKASAYAGAAGALDFVFNKIGLDKAKDLAVKELKETGIKQFLAKNAVAGLGEAAENVYQDIAQSLFDNLINREKSEWRTSFDNKVANGMSATDAFKEVAKEYGEQLAVSGLTGYGMGSVMQAGKSVVPKIPDLIEYMNVNSNLGFVDPAVRNFINGVPEVNNASKQATNAAAEINRLSEQIPNVPGDTTRIDNPENPSIMNDTNSERSAVYGQEANVVDRRTDTGSIGREEFEPGRQEVNRSMDGQRTYTREDGRTFNLRNVVDERTSRLMDDAGLNNFDLRDTSNNREGFSSQLAEAKAANPNGRMVSNQSPEDLTDARIFTDPTGTAGVAIKPDGDIVGVHKHPKNGMGKAVDDLLITARANGGDRLDCYGAGLVNKYERDGFIPVAQVEWNEKFKPEDWGDNPPETVYVMMKDNRTNEQVLNDYKNGTFKLSTPEDLANLKKFTIDEYGDDAYFEALDYRDRLLDGQPTNEGAFSNAQNFPAVDGVIPRTMNESAAQNPRLTQSIGNVPPETPPSNGGNVPPDDRTGISRVTTHSAKNAGVVTQDELDNDEVIKDITKYAKHNNETTLENAKENVINNGEQLLAEFNSGKRSINSDQTVDESFLLLRSLTNQIEELGENAPQELRQQRYLLLNRLREAGTKYGQTIQAFAKWNKTADGAIVNSQKIIGDRVKKYKGRNQEQVNINEELAEKINEIGRDYNDTAIRNEGSYQKPRQANEAERTSGRLDKALRRQGYDGTMEPAPKAPKTHEQHRVEVENSIRRELGSVADQFTNNDFEYLTSLVENKVPVDIIADEIEHRLNHGKWYTIDESTPVKKATSSKLAKVLKNMGDDSLKTKNKPLDNGYPKKSHATIVEEVTNTLQGEPAGLGLDTPTDIEFISTMIEEGVPDWQIEDEINHRLMTGEWYTIDESTQPKIPVDQKLRNALNSLVDTEEKPAPQELTFDEIRERVKRTLDDEPASEGVFSDDDIDYIAFLRKNGATTAEIAEALNTKYATGSFGISAETEESVNGLFKLAEKAGLNSKTGIDAMMQAYKLIADETVGKASPFEKFEAWRYLAMLGNTKTMMRNAVGNVMFNAVTDFSNGLSALIESGIDKTLKAAGGQGIKRQKALLNLVKDDRLISAAWNDGTQNRWGEISGTKYEKSTRDTIKRQKSVFDSKILRLYEKATDMGISDTGFVHTKYSTSLAGYLKANGLNEDAFRAEQRYNRLKQDSQTRVLTNYEKAEMQNLKGIVDTLEKARDYAVKQAEYATFHEDNALAQWLSKNVQEARGSDNLALRAVGTIAEGILPFKKTPANILKSGFEYSPLGAIDSIAKTGKLIYENTGKRKTNLADTYQKTNKITGKLKDVDRSLASDVIESWAKTLTGTGLAMLGFYLADKGILRAGGKGDKYQNDLEGKQQYSIEINGKTYTVDWAAPAVMPMLLGAEAQKVAEDNLVSNESVFKNIDKTVGTLNALLDPILETSFMQGVQNAFESAANQVKYKNEEDSAGSVIGGIAGAFASNALTSYLTQGLPTFSGQIARTVDPIRRATDTSTESNFLSEWEKTARKTANKIPFLSKYVNEPYYDAYGRTQDNSPTDNMLANFAYQALSPAYIADINVNAADRSARKAYNGKDSKGNRILDSKVFASWKNNVKIDGEKLSPRQMAEYRQTTGEANYDIRTALAQEDWFNNLSATEQTDLLKKVNTLVDKIGRSPYTDVTGADYEAYEKGGIPTLLDYYKNKKAKDQVTEQTGLSASSNANKAIVEQVEQGNQEVANQMIDDATIIKNAGLTNPGPTYTFYSNPDVFPNMTADEFVKVYKAIDENSNQGITVDEIIKYLNRTQQKNQAEGEKIWKKFKPGNAKKVPQLKIENGKYIWKKAK